MALLAPTLQSNLSDYSDLVTITNLEPGAIVTVIVDDQKLEMASLEVPIICLLACPLTT